MFEDSAQLEWLAHLLVLPIAEAEFFGKIASQSPAKPRLESSIFAGCEVSTLSKHSGSAILPTQQLQACWLGNIAGLRPTGMSTTLAKHFFCHFYGNGETGIVDVLNFYTLLAKAFLDYDGEAIRLCLDQKSYFPLPLNSVNGLLLWRNIGSLLGIDLLPTLFLAQQSPAVWQRFIHCSSTPHPFCSKIEARLIKDAGGLADCHVHVQSAFRAELLWPMFLGKLLTDPGLLIQFSPQFLQPHDHINQYLPLFYLAAALRMALELFLLDSSATTDVFKRLKGLMIDVPSSALTGAWIPKANWVGQLLDLLSRLQQRLQNRQIAKFDAHSGLNTYTEFDHEPCLMLKVAIRLFNHDKNDNIELTWAFWTYVQIKAKFQRHFIQQPGLEGLEFFRHIFERGKALDAQSSLLHSITAMSNHLGADGLVSYLELRTSPDLQPVEALVTGIQKANASPVKNKPLLAGVVHFVKWRSLYGTDAEAGVIKALEEMRSQATELKEYLKHKNCHSDIVGLDVAGPELYRPNWLYLPLFQEIRPWWRETFGRDLGYSFHAGEDFLHLMQGLRQMAEIVRYFPWQRGDRIGHGLALGFDAFQWQRDHPAIVCPADVAWFDLLFEWSLLTRGEMAFVQHDGYLWRIEHEIKSLAPLALSPAIAGQLGSDMEEYAIFYRGLFCPKLVLELLGGKNPTRWHTDDSDNTYQQIKHKANVCKALRSYLESLHKYTPPTRAYPLRSSDDDLALERARLVGIQAWLTNAIKKRGIALEICPSSNLLIRGLAGMHEHPVLDLATKVTVLINTDNPATFATDLATEYRLVYEAALSRHGDSEKALAIVNEFISNSHRYRFGGPNR